jgi:DNA adenine methylase Dam
MQLKTPLRYPGGKSRAMKVLGTHFPTTIKEYREPFLGGGSVALWVTENYPDADIWVNDLYYNLYCFWTTLQKNPTYLYDELTKLKNDVGDDGTLGRQLYTYMREEINKPETSMEDRAVFMFALNRMSFSGLGESSGISVSAQKSNFSYNAIHKIPLYSNKIKNWKITNIDYRELMSDNNPDALIFLDPPYEIDSSLYGKGGKLHTNFDHDEFAAACNACSSPQFITYNSDQKVKQRFPQWQQQDWDLTYTMRSDSTYTTKQKSRKELILKNY